MARLAAIAALLILASSITLLAMALAIVFSDMLYNAAMSKNPPKTIKPVITSAHSGAITIIITTSLLLLIAGAIAAIILLAETLATR